MVISGDIIIDLLSSLSVIGYLLSDHHKQQSAKNADSAAEILRLIRDSKKHDTPPRVKRSISHYISD